MPSGDFSSGVAGLMVLNLLTFMYSLAFVVSDRVDSLTRQRQCGVCFARLVQRLSEKISGNVSSMVWRGLLNL